jgi:hypothetical protein
MKRMLCISAPYWHQACCTLSRERTGNGLFNVAGLRCGLCPKRSDDLEQSLSVICPVYRLDPGLEKAQERNLRCWARLTKRRRGNGLILRLRARMAPRFGNWSGPNRGDGCGRGETDRSTFSDASRCYTPSARSIPAAVPEVPSKRQQCNLQRCSADSKLKIKVRRPPLSSRAR